MRSLVQFFVCTVFIVIIMDLKPFFDGSIDEPDVIEHRPIIGLVPIIYGTDMPDAGFEIFV